MLRSNLEEALLREDVTEARGALKMKNDNVSKMEKKIQGFRVVCGFQP
jgi:hypothetical protein